jgi:hypothetical protein
MTCRGTVKGNVVVLDENVKLPEGAAVEVRVIETAISREEAFARVLRQREANKDLRIGIDEIIEEDRQDREDRVDGWLSPEP